MFATSVLEFTNVVEFTATPPVFVVPLTYQVAAAPCSKPLPDTVTFNAVVPCAALLGVAVLTATWAAAGLAFRPRTNTQALKISSDRQCCRAIRPPCAFSESLLCLTTRTALIFFAKKVLPLIHIPHKYKRRPKIRLTVRTPTVPHCPLGCRQSNSFILPRQPSIELHH